MAYSLGAPKETAGDHVASQIITAIADQTATDALDLPPLHEAVDVDALVALVQSEGTSRVVFSYQGHEVDVDGHGNVRVSD